MLWTIFILLLVLWALGWGFHVAGAFVHVLLLAALVLLVVRLVAGGRSPA